MKSEYNSWINALFYSKAIRMEKFLQNKYNKRFAPPENQFATEHYQPRKIKIYDI